MAVSTAWAPLPKSARMVTMEIIVPKMRSATRTNAIAINAPQVSRMVPHAQTIPYALPTFVWRTFANLKVVTTLRSPARIPGTPVRAEGTVH